MSDVDRKPRDFWIIYEKGYSTWVSDKPLYSGDTVEELHVREVLPDVDSKPSTINLKFPAFDIEDTAKEHVYEFPRFCTLGEQEKFMRLCEGAFKSGAEYQHSIDAQHFEAVTAELYSIIDMLFKTTFHSLGKFNSQLDTQEYIGLATDGARKCREAIAEVDERLAKLKGAP